jgi:hypothetical protein
MTPAELARSLRELKAAGFSSAELTRLHHFSLKNRIITFGEVISYLGDKRYLLGNNIAFAERCHYVADQLRSGHTDKAELLRQALARTPLGVPLDSIPAVTSIPRPQRVPSTQEPQVEDRRTRSKRLGDEGEEFTLELLHQRGYVANKLRTNYPTYDIQVQAAASSFCVSVKVSRSKQHVRLGSRRSVDRLASGNFVFAFLPLAPGEIDLPAGRYRILIMPAEEVRADALCVYDQYWAKKGTSDGYSVMIKAYDSRQNAIWSRWLKYTDAWNQLPSSAELGPNPAAPADEKLRFSAAEQRDRWATGY